MSAKPKEIPHGPGRLALTILTVLLAPTPAEATATPLKTHELPVTVYGEDPCPKPADAEEIVVCARKPKGERFRIPEPLRGIDPEAPAHLAWSQKVELLDDASRHSRPGSCSAVGSGGQTGCLAAMMRQWFLERRGAR